MKHPTSILAIDGHLYEYRRELALEDRNLLSHGPLSHFLKKRSVTLYDGLRVKEMAQPLKEYGAGQLACASWENEAGVGDRMVTMVKATVER